MVVDSHVDLVQKEIMPILKHKNKRNGGKVRRDNHHESDDIQNAVTSPKLLVTSLQRDGEKEEAEELTMLAKNPHTIEDCNCKCKCNR